MELSDLARRGASEPGEQRPPSVLRQSSTPDEASSEHPSGVAAGDEARHSWVSSHGSAGEQLALDAMAIEQPLSFQRYRGSGGGAIAQPLSFRRYGGGEPAGLDSRRPFVDLQLGESGGAGVLQDDGSPRASAWAPMPAERSIASADGHKTLPLLYEIWNTQVRGPTFGFMCGGRLIRGPKADNKHHAFAWTVIVLPTILYFVFPAFFFWAEVSPALPVATASLFLVTLVMFGVTSYTDPGYIPRPGVQLAVPGLVQRTSEVTSTPFVQLDEYGIEPVCDISMEEIRHGFRWCEHCKIMKPPRTSHCSDCNTCVMDYDHHCPFVQNCIGRRNYVFFFLFVVSVITLGVFVLSQFWVWYWNSACGACMREKGHHSVEHILLICMAVVTAFVVFMVTALGSFHVFLVCTGKTTKEALTCKKPPPKKGAPIDLEAPLTGSAIALCEKQQARGLRMHWETHGEGAATGATAANDGGAPPAAAATVANGREVHHPGWISKLLNRQPSLLLVRERVSSTPLRTFP